ncbi:MAG: DNA polymerase III subunit gamma/tau [Anaerolinea sp.]
MAQALYRKWRPRLWEQVVGQDHIIQTLHNAVRTGRVGHAYLFAGPRGTGKTTTARLLAKAVNCLDEDPTNRPCDHCAHCVAVNEGRFLDLIEIDAASNTSVEDVRDLRDKINFAPSQGRYKVYIIDEVHMLSTAAFNALLKTLEEPPPHAIFILATTEVHKIPATVLSRCQRHEFRRVPVQQIAALLRQKAAEDGLAVDEDALVMIARQATGSFRDAISILDQLSSTGERVTLEMVQSVLGTAAGEPIRQLVDAILARDAARGLQIIQQTLDGGADPRQFARQVVDYLRGLLLVRMNNAALVDATPENRAQMAAQAGRFEVEQLVEVIRLFHTAAVEARTAVHPGLGLELALVEATLDRTSPEAPGMNRPAAASPQIPAPAESPAVSSAPARAERAKVSPAPSAKPAAGASAPKSAPASADRAPVSPGTSAGLTQEHLRQNWDKVRALVRGRNSLTAAALNSCRTYALKDGVLVLVYQTEVLKKKMETEDNLALLRAALKQVLGVDMPVRCVVSARGTLPDESEGGSGNSMVHVARSLGGELVDKREHPFPDAEESGTF